MRNSLIWLPQSAKELICLDSEQVHDIDTQIFINQALVNWLNGRLDTGTLTDILLQNDINPYIIDEFETHINNIGKLC